MIGGLLSRHPRIAYLFQPFSSTEVHRTQFEIWRSEHRAPGTEQFFSGLLQGKLDRSYIASDWFEKHSTSLQVEPDKLNLIKETKLHFKIEWIKARFPQIAILGIRRDPRAIVCSLMRNDFYAKWYGAKAFAAAARTVSSEPALASLVPLFDGSLSDTEKMALIVAARTRYMVDRLPASDWIAYEDVLEDPNRALGGILERFGLAAFDFSNGLRDDFNVIGKPFESPDLWQGYFSADQIRRLDAIFHVAGLGEAACHQLPHSEGQSPDLLVETP